MLRVEHLTVTFPGPPAVTAVDDVSLRLPLGEVLAVLGPSGCGKSTLLRAVAGLEHVDGGRVLFAGEDVTGVPTHKRGFALMFQDGQLFPHLDVAGNIAYPLRLRRTPPAQRASRVSELLELVGLPGYADRSPTTLSGGERQRVALARALAVRPRLLLLDEPLSALDRGLRERLAGDLHDILRNAGTTALLVTHDQGEAFAIADRMAVMRSGRIVQTGTLQEVWRQPVDADTARFLGYARVLEPEAAARLAQVTGTSLPPGAALAVRRSALQVDPAGPLRAEVVAARVAPDLTRLVVDVKGVGTMDAVSGPDLPVRPGESVRLRLDPGRRAVLTGRGADGTDGLGHDRLP